MKAALVVVVALAGVVLAQEKPAPRPEQFLELAFKYRREGSFDAAAAALDETVRRLSDKQADERRTILLEAYDVAFVQSKFERCARLAKGIDAPREARALLLAKKPDDALKAARESHDAFAEGLVLRALGRVDEALDVLARGGTPGMEERAALLEERGRFLDAAKTREALADPLAQALDLERAGDAGAAAIFEAARADVKKRLEALIALGNETKKRLESAQGLVARERARYALADTHEQLSREYERYSIVHEKAKDLAKARKLAELALQFAEEERRTLTDGGRDRFGEARAARLAPREAALRERLRNLRG